MKVEQTGVGLPCGRRIFYLGWLLLLVGGAKRVGIRKTGGPMIQDPGRPAMEICLFQEAAAGLFLLVLVSRRVPSDYQMGRIIMSTRGQERPWWS